MTKKELAEQLKHSSPREIYVVTHYGVLRRLFCPFQVKVLQDIGELKNGQLVLVDEIKVTFELINVYIINEQAYYYYHFDILM